MTDVAHLELKVTSSGVESAVAGLKGLSNQAGSTESHLARMAKHAQAADDRMAKLQGTLMGTFIGGAIATGIGAIVKATIDSENATAQLEARLKSTGNQVRMTKDQLLGLSTSLQGVTIFDDEAITNAESLLLTFTRIGHDVFPKATEAVLNVSTAMGTDLNSAALQVGKALNDPVHGIQALARAGIQFTVSQKEVIKDLVKTGKTADAQRIILAELETQMGGAARAARTTLGGALKGVANDFANLLESDGNGLPDAVDALGQLSATLKDPAVKQGFADIVTGVVNLTTMIADAIPKLVAYNQQLGIMSGLEDAGAAGVRHGNILDLGRGVYNAVGGAKDYLTADDDIDRQNARNRMDYADSQTASSWRGGTYQKTFQNNMEVPDALKVPGLNGNPTFSAVPFSATAPTGGYSTKSQSGGDLVSDEDDGPSKKAAKAAERAANQRAEALQNLRESLMSEEEAIMDSYEKREKIIADTTKRGSADQIALHKKSEAMRDADLADLKQQKMQEVESIRESLLTEEDSIRESYQRRLAIIEANMEPGDARAKLEQQLEADTQVKLQHIAEEKVREHDLIMQASMTEAEYRRSQMEAEILEQKAALDRKIINVEEYERNKKAIEERYAAIAKQNAADHAATEMDRWGNMFGALGQLTAQAAKGSSKSAERAFKVAKALSIAQAVMSTAAAIMKANADPALVYPANIVESVRIAALGAVQIASISSQQYSGAYDKGGFIPGGKVGIVGEKGMEIVEGPAHVTGRSETKRLLEQAAAGGGKASSGGGVTTAPAIVHISTTVTASGSTTNTSGSDERDARELSSKIDNRVREVLQQEERQGGILWKRRHGG